MNNQYNVLLRLYDMYDNATYQFMPNCGDDIEDVLVYLDNNAGEWGNAETLAWDIVTISQMPINIPAGDK